MSISFFNIILKICAQSANWPWSFCGKKVLLVKLDYVQWYTTGHKSLKNIDLQKTLNYTCALIDNNVLVRDTLLKIPLGGEGLLKRIS